MHEKSPKPRAILKDKTTTYTNNILVCFLVYPTYTLCVVLCNDAHFTPFGHRLLWSSSLMHVGFGAKRTTSDSSLRVMTQELHGLKDRRIQQTSNKIHFKTHELGNGTYQPPPPNWGLTTSHEVPRRDGVIVYEHTSLLSNIQLWNSM